MTTLRTAFALAAATLVASPALAAPAAQVAKPQTADAQFAGIADLFITLSTRLSPVEATVLGEHRHDHLLPDVTAKGRAARAAAWRQLLGALGRIDRAQLSRENQVDAAMLENELRYRLWMQDTVQDWAWNAQVYNDIAAGALYGLAARDFAPWDVRLKSATARMEALPRFLRESRRQLVPARVPRVFAEVVASQNGGIVEIAEGMLAPQAGVLKPADRARFDTALKNLKQAVAEQQVWLDTVLVPQAKGDFRLGAQLYD